MGSTKKKNDGESVHTCHRVLCFMSLGKGASVAHPGFSQYAMNRDLDQYPVPSVNHGVSGHWAVRYPRLCGGRVHTLM